VLADREAGDAVEAVGDDLAAHRIHAHLQALGGDLGTEAGTDLGLGLGVQREFQSERGARGLARAVVGGGADATEAEHHVAGGEGLRSVSVRRAKSSPRSAPTTA
jgi:hypothetical protein